MILTDTSCHLLHTLSGLRRHSRLNLTVADDFKQTGAFGLGQGSQLCNSRRTYPSLWFIYYSGKRQIVRRIKYQSHISDHILYLFTVIISYSAYYFIRNIPCRKRLFKSSGLRVSSVQHSKIRVFLQRTFHTYYFLRHICCFVLFIVSSPVNDLVTFLLLGP